MNKGTLLCIVLFAVLFVVQVANADLYMKQKQITGAFSMMGQDQPAQQFITESWIADNAVWTKMGDQGMLMKEDGGMIMFDHVNKTYTEMNLNPEKMADEMRQDMDAEDMADFKKFMGKMMDSNISVEATGEKKKIKGYNCIKYIQTMDMGMGKNTSIIWATTDIKIDAEAYAKFTASMLANQPGMEKSLDKIQKEMKKIKGVQILNETTMNIMGQDMKTTVELLEIKQSEAPAQVFSIPKGYKKKALGF